ncbi:MAG: TnsA-like heteromeric transposase endonuclease subunit [Brevibacterium sp.]|nr:TnsA-like heteromeric transposase endonuclease subunit [Brevibacterium sp.]
MNELATEVRFQPTETAELEATSLALVNSHEVISGAPVRLPPSYHGQKNFPGLFWLATTHKTVVYESLLERDRLWLADFDPDITGVATQPLHLQGKDGPHLRRHVPDMLLEHRDGNFTLVDVKPKDKLSDKRVQDQFAWTGRLCRAKGWTYEIWTGAEPTLLRNLRFIAVGRRAQFLYPEVLDELESLGQPGMSLAQAEQAAGRLTDASTLRMAVLALLWSSRWHVDLTVPLSSQATLTEAPHG